MLATLKRAALATLLLSSTAYANPPISTALVLAADVSSSINQERFKLQREGYAAAITNPDVLRTIRDTERGRIAVTYIEWAGQHQQQVIVPWTIIETVEDAERVATLLIQSPRPFGGSTSISGAIDFAMTMIASAPSADRYVIDVSGDGVNNEGRDPSAARDAALTQNVTINGLVIVVDQPNGWRPPNEPPLDEHYRDSVIGGPGAFVIRIDDFDAFAYAIVNKLVREIAALQTAPAN